MTDHIRAETSETTHRAVPFNESALAEVRFHELRRERLSWTRWQAELE